jgi:hypothetical protein
MKSNLVEYAIGVPIALALGTLAIRIWLRLYVKHKEVKTGETI